MNKRTTPIIIGNWKTTPATKEEAIKFVKQLDKKISSIKFKLPKKSYYLAVPDIFIPHISSVTKSGYIGSQNVSGTSLGEITGVTVPSMLLSGGAEFTIIGHSEVRAKGEKIEDRAKKVALSLQSKLTTVLCIGEQERDNQGTYLATLEEDVVQSLSLVPKHLLSNLIIAYEPIWAIGRDKPATPSECFEAVIALRRALATLLSIDYAKKVNIIYGGSIEAEDAKIFLTDGGVDGLLVGRASQKVASFAEIISTCYQK